MIFQFSALTLVLLGSAATPSFADDSQCPSTWTCMPTSTPPVLDADHSDWADVDAFTTNLITYGGTEYSDGDEAVYKCLYDADLIYFAMEIPGDYRFSTDDDHLCAAIGTMFKVGEKATFLDMGGCPDALNGCTDGVPDTCTDYTVDLGAHWELSGTEQNTLYGVSESVVAATNRRLDDVTDSGNDLIANKDDEYGVSPTCRFDDDDANAANEWSGAWAHTNSVEGEAGMYHFEMSRLLRTASNVSDAQLAAGDTIQFGIAFWDPYQNEETGWTASGHYLTGCGTKWIDLELATEEAEGTETLAPTTTDGEATDEAESTETQAPTTDGESSGAVSMGAFGSLALLSFVAGLVV